MVKHLAAACLLWVFGVPDGRTVEAPPAAVEDGIYLRPVEGEQGPSVTTSRPSADRVAVGERIGTGFGTATMVSMANDNSQYRLTLKGAGPVTSYPPGHHVLVIDGVGLLVGSHSDPDEQGHIELGAQVYSKDVAQRVAEKLAIEPVLRTRPGHQLDVRWSADQPSYKPGKPVTLTMEIRNVGSVPIAFRVGGQQRGPRDNQFRFIAQRMGGYGTALPDTGDPENEGGPGSRPVVKPGESFTKSVEVTRWFTFEEPGTYRITGIYELELADPDEGLDGPVLWEELIAGECMVRITDE